jgi:GTP-binding protein
MKEWLDFYSIPYVIVATKVDKLKTSERAKLESRIKKGFKDESVKIFPFSAKTREGRDKLLKQIGEFISG